MWIWNRHETPDVEINHYLIFKIKLHGAYQGAQKHYSDYYICDPHAHPTSYMSSFLTLAVSSCSGGSGGQPLHFANGETKDQGVIVTEQQRQN